MIQPGRHDPEHDEEPVQAQDLDHRTDPGVLLADGQGDYGRQCLRARHAPCPEAGDHGPDDANGDHASVDAVEGVAFNPDQADGTDDP